MTIKKTLIEVKRDFEDWRKTRANRRTNIPDSLWRSAVALTKDYRVSEIMKTLRLSGNDFLKKRRLFDKSLEGKKSIEQEFSQISFAPQVSLTATEPLSSVEFKRQDTGASMVVRVPQEQVQGMIQAFLGGAYATTYPTK